MPPKLPPLFNRLGRPNKEALHGFVADLRDVMGTYDLELMQDDGQCVMRMDDCDYFYVAFRPFDFKPKRPREDRTEEYATRKRGSDE